MFTLLHMLWSHNCSHLIKLIMTYTQNNQHKINNNFDRNNVHLEANS